MASFVWTTTISDTHSKALIRLITSASSRHFISAETGCQASWGMRRSRCITGITEERVFTLQKTSLTRLNPGVKRCSKCLIDAGSFGGVDTGLTRKCACGATLASARGGSRSVYSSSTAIDESSNFGVVADCNAVDLGVSVCEDNGGDCSDKLAEASSVSAVSI